MLSLSHEDVLQLLPQRKENAHKGDFGKLLLLCGSRNCTGAPAFAAMGALRCGAGLVYLAVPECIYEIEAIKLTEPVMYPLPCVDGMLSEAAYAQIEHILNNMSAVLIGPGLGKSNGTEAITCQVLESFSGPIVIDADGINVLNQHKDILRRRTGATILTPHEGEFLRFGGCLDYGRAEGAKAMASDLGCIVVLKGHHSIITDGESSYINTTGNPGMATGGSGDVLAGIITGLIGQGLDPLKAAAAGAWLHGSAGDLCADNFGQYGMLPTDMLSVLPRLLK